MQQNNIRPFTDARSQFVIEQVSIPPSDTKKKGKNKPNKKRQNKPAPNHFVVVLVGCVNGLKIYTRLNKKKSSFVEEKIDKMLFEAGVFYIREAQFNKHKYFFDFYFPTVNTVVEYDGVEFHSNPSDVIRDSEKAAYLKSIGVKLISIDKDSMDILDSFVASIPKV
jgi:very-short-patch-repair endonuclease